MNNYVKNIVVDRQTNEIIEFLQVYIGDISKNVSIENFIYQIFSGSYLENELKYIIEKYMD